MTFSLLLLDSRDASETTSLRRSGLGRAGLRLDRKSGLLLLLQTCRRREEEWNSEQDQTAKRSSSPVSELCRGAQRDLWPSAWGVGGSWEELQEGLSSWKHVRLLIQGAAVSGEEEEQVLMTANWKQLCLMSLNYLHPPGCKGLSGGSGQEAPAGVEQQRHVRLFSLIRNISFVTQNTKYGFKRYICVDSSTYWSNRKWEDGLKQVNLRKRVLFNKNWNKYGKKGGTKENQEDGFIKLRRL